ncbi:MAG: aspartate/glutamate racemase family protein, partial [Clostridia bacterium]|nr:aspartate/glutamate racemase family protein [Clostridia bacterium]
GIDCIRPTQDDQKTVMRIIYDDIKNGRDPDVEAFLAVSERLRDAGADVLILGCTELSLIKKHYPLPPYFIDSLDVLAASTIAACGKTPIGFDFSLGGETSV